MQNVMPESLQNTQNDFMRIFKEAENTHEMTMATYLRALENDVFRFYRPLRNPPMPDGWLDAYQDYLAVSGDTKSKLWRGIQDKFKGYLSALQQTKDENLSNYAFLFDMREFFKLNRMFQQHDQVDQRIKEFLSSGVL